MSPMASTATSVANNLLSLVRELRELIAASWSSSTPASTHLNSSRENDDALDSRLRSALHEYVVPSPSANEREVVAVLKLISHTARILPRAFHHGKASTVLPVIGRILPFFAEPTFCSRHGVVFETVGSLLSLLQTGAPDSYRLFFLDAMVAIEDIFSIGFFKYDSLSTTDNWRLTLKCFHESFHGVFSDSTCLCDLPANNKPVDGPGILINLLGKERWQPFATWIIKLICKCLTEGTQHVEGLINMSFMSATCLLLRYGDACLHMACFEFARIMGSVIASNIIPHENLIQSICTILSEDKGLFVFRDVRYDSSLGACLEALHSSCPDAVVKLTAPALVNIFLVSMSRTKSQELKIAFCRVYIRIVKTCPPNIWRPQALVDTLLSSDPCLLLIDCFHAALSFLDLDSAGRRRKNGIGSAVDNSFENCRVEEKRHVHDVNTFKIKRQKIDGGVMVSDVNVSVGHKLTRIIDCKIKEEYEDHMHSSLLSFVELLDPPSVKPGSVKADIAATALSLLCITFSRYPQMDVSLLIFNRMHAWIPWICERAKEGRSVGFDVSIFLEGIHHILLSHCTHLSEVELFNNKGDSVDLLVVLKLAWTNPVVVAEPHPPWKTKCIAVQVVSKLGQCLQTESVLEVLDLALFDEAELVRIEAVKSLPVIVLWSGLGLLPHIFRRLEYLEKDKHEDVRKFIPFSLGLLSCLYGSCNDVEHLDKSSCKLFLISENGIHNQTTDLLQGFWCSKCDSTAVHDQELSPKFINVSNVDSLDAGFSCNFMHLLSIFFNLICDESSEEVQLACVGVIRRILVHGAVDILLKTRSEWIKSIEYLLLNRKKAIRDAFSTQISSFFEDRILSYLFTDVNTSAKGIEQSCMDIIKHALSATDDPQITETILESTAEIMMAVDIQNRLFLFSLILLVEQLDSRHMIVRMSASRLIHKSCCFHLKGGFKVLVSKDVYIRNELFNYLTARIGSHPKLVKEFAEAVFGVETEEFVRKMLPVVLPKLVVSLQNNDQAFDILYELAKCLNTDMVTLIVNWLPKVLAFALHQSELDLLSSLNFYCAYTGSDKQEIFAAALPALLGELVCFVDGGDSDEMNKRLARVPQLIKKIAVVLTGSEDLPGFLRNHFVGLLTIIDRKMLHSEEISLQKQALIRIEMLITMMGSHLSTYVPKLMVLLMYAIDNESLHREGLSVLQIFIEQLARVSPSSTKHIIPQVFAALFPLLERDKEISSMLLNQVVKILEELVLKNRGILKQHIREFPLLPTLPVLIEVNKGIQEARGSMTLKDQLRYAVDGLNHENLKVRFMVVCELSKLLNHRREDVAALINGDTGSDMEILSSLISSLLRGCADQSKTSMGQRLKLVCADCLGALGAVDPAKVKVFSCQLFKIERSDDDLIFELIDNHLARVFRSAPDAIIQDSAALAIQELLKFAGCEASLDENAACSVSQLHPLKDKELRKGVTSGSSSVNKIREMNMRGQKLWDRFSNHVKEIIAPCLTSRFQLSNVSDSASVGPIYRSSMSFRRWIFCWIKKLTAHAIGSRASIFNACQGIVRHDMQTAIYLLPYLVLNVVCHGTEEARGGIAEEILCVLSAAAEENGAPAVHGVNGGESEVCIRAIFTLLDNLGQWVDHVGQELALSQDLLPSSKQQASKSKNSNPFSLSDPDNNPLLIQCKDVSELLTLIPKVTLAKASFRCQAYARALMYFESHVHGKSGSFNPAAERSGIFEDEDVSFLMEIYSCLDEPDGLCGLTSLRKSLSRQDELLINKRTGNWAEAFTSCEQALQMEPNSVQRQSDVLNCLLNTCHLQAMITHVDGLISRIPQYKKTWCMQGVQAAWRLGRWHLMDEYLSGADEEGLLCSSSESNASFDVDVAKILQAIMKKDHSLVGLQVGLSKQALIAALAAAGMDSYIQAYPFIVKLHLLQELEDFNALLNNDSFLEKSFHSSDLKFSKVMENWENRLRVTQPSIWVREPLLAFRRLVFAASNLGAQVGDCWLQYAKLCRMTGNYETSNLAILYAQASGAPNVHMEKAKLLWSKKRLDGAIAELQQFLLNMPADILGSATISAISSLSHVPLNRSSKLCDSQTLTEKQNIARALLLYARWIHYSGQKHKGDVITLFSRVTELQPTWEKGHFYWAKYCDEILVDARKRQAENAELPPRILSSSVIAAAANSDNEKHWWCYLPDVLLCYAKGLQMGHKNLFHALPRLLTLWFDFGSFYQRSVSSLNKELKSINSKVISIMRGCLKDLPTYQWLAVLPQLVSRICHQNEEIVRLVKCIITAVIREYPQQGLWIMAAVSKSTVPSRREAAAEIIQAARKEFGQGNSGSNLFSEFASLIDHLIRLCFHQGQQKSRTINISSEFGALRRMMPLGIIMPTQHSLSVSMPVYDANLTDSFSSGIFSTSDLPTILGIANEAEILSSLKRPKKIILLGSDGIERPFLCKPKDDLRKDARMMEFTAMINRLLSKYAESRCRKLYIRTFAVIPLTEDCGMVEWVPHTHDLRDILQDIYISCGKFDKQNTNPQINRIYDECIGKMPEDEMLKIKILPMFPPVFHKWFLSNFFEPAAWFRARIAFAHTTAVWSMVGHIVGLGDRRGENILLDSTTGDCVHVDFSCLFDKGLLLEKPELVPFRLTQNMIAGLGITGYEGVFLRACEITLSVLRTHRENLLIVLETFIHDPLIEWTKSHKSSGVEVQNSCAQRAIGNIEARLQGVVVGVGAAPSLPLAVGGQARRLIAEAISHENLGKMYIWWMAWF